MPRQSEAVSTTMLDLVGKAIAAATDTEFQADTARLRAVVPTPIATMTDTCSARSSIGVDRGSAVTPAIP